MKSAAVSIFTLLCLFVFVFASIFIFSANAGIQYERVAMTGDRPLNIDTPNPTPIVAETRENTETTSANTVLWISIPGFRNDYLEKAGATFFRTMANEGAQTAKLLPNFPCLTYPAHVTLATGTTPDIHGIPADRFKVNGNIVDRPTNPDLLQAEPIWQTATRQGISTVIYDWPLSPNQSLNLETTDRQRLDRLWNDWVARNSTDKPRLLMCRLDQIHKAGLEFGPRTEEVMRAVRDTEQELSAFIDKVKAAWPNLRVGNKGNLTVLITTDHGMAELDININLPDLLGPKLLPNLDVAAHDSIAHLYFKDLPNSAGEANLTKQQIEREVKKYTYLRTYRKDDLPNDWNYGLENERIGDLVLVLKSGFAFTDYAGEEPVMNPGEGPGLHGGYGYPHSDSMRMAGQVIVWGYPEQRMYGDLGEIDQTVFHSTVCEWLEIEPSTQAGKVALPMSGF